MASGDSLSISFDSGEQKESEAQKDGSQSPGVRGARRSGFGDRDRRGRGESSCRQTRHCKCRIQGHLRDLSQGVLLGRRVRQIDGGGDLKPRTTQNKRAQLYIFSQKEENGQTNDTTMPTFDTWMPLASKRLADPAERRVTSETTTLTRL